MTRQRKWLLTAALLLCGTVSWCVLATALNPARQSDEEITAEILAATPLGSTEEAVDRYAKSRFQQDNFFHWHKDEKSRRLSLLYGCYQKLEHFPFASCVRLTWYFEDGKVAKVEVSRWLDGP